MKQVYGVVLLVVVLLAHQALARELSPIGPIKELKDCEWMCLAVYSPVCGSDGTTYSNYCTFGLAQCKNPSLKLKHPGGCETAARDAHVGDDVKIEEVPNLNPQMFVKCEELGGECVQGDQGNQCKVGSSTENDGMCFFREMVCCAPDIGQFVRIEEELFQKNLEPWMPAVKCGELEGECLHHHHAKHHCKGGKSLENDGNCPNKMVCCAPVMTYPTTTEGTDGTEVED